MIVYQLLAGVHARSRLKKIQKMSAMETLDPFAKELVDACLARRYDRITFEGICKRLKDNANLLLPVGKFPLSMKKNFPNWNPMRSVITRL